MVPKYSARANAASFPLGSIIPYISCSTLKISPSLSSAEVPIIREHYLVILIYIFLGSSPYLDNNLITVSNVIILVRLATSRLYVGLRDSSTVLVSQSKTQNDWAEISGPSLV
jgi:hypothetical protein